MLSVRFSILNSGEVNFTSPLPLFPSPEAQMAPDSEEKEEEEEVPEAKDPSTPLSEGLVTLSVLPKSRWHNLSQLDIIKVQMYMSCRLSCFSVHSILTIFQHYKL